MIFGPQTTNSKRTALACLVLAAITGLLFWPVATHDFVLFDDSEYVRDNFHIFNGFSWAGLKWCFTAFYSCNWHPLTWVSHMTDCQLFGLRPGGHHATSALLHIANSTLLFLLLQRLTKAFWPSAVAAALFAWHPLHVESVAWVSERKDVLSTLFFLLTLLAYAAYVQSKVQGSKFKVGEAPPSSILHSLSSRYYLLALFLFALGLMSKPMLVTLPFVLLLLDYWPLGRVRVESEITGRGSAPSPLSRSLSLLLEKFPFFILAAISCFITLKAQKQGGAVLSLETMPLTTRLLHVPLAYWQYIEKTIYPVHLAVFYPYAHILTLVSALVPIVGLIIITTLAVRWRRTKPYWLVGWFWFLGTLVPVIGIIQVGEQTVADRYSYIPLIGLLIIVCWEVFAWAEESKRNQIIATGGTVAALCVCLVLTPTQLSYWKDSGTLFAHVIEVMPENHVAHAVYALYLSDHHQLQKAQTEAEASLRISPDYSLGHLHLGQILFLQNKLDEAEKHLRRAAELYPGLTDANRLLGEIFLARNSPAAAVEQLELGLKISPNAPNLHCVLGRALMMLGKLPEAEAELRAALQLVSQYPEAHYQLALALSAQKKIKEAASHYREALQLEPNFPEALNNLAWLLAADADPNNRNGGEAVKMAEQACALTHNQQTMMIGTLAAAYAEAGRFPEAIASAEKARQLALDHGEKNLAEKNSEMLLLYRANRPYHEP